MFVYFIFIFMSIDLSDRNFSLNRSEDLPVIEDVVGYIDENYAKPLRQGPVHITGSAVYGEDPNDYDIVVQRQAEDERDFTASRYRDRKVRRPNAVSSDRDDEVIAAMMRDLSEDIVFDTFDETNTAKRTRGLLKRSTQVRPRKVGQDHDPEFRYELELQDVDFDIVFTPSRPNREYLTLTDSHR